MANNKSYTIKLGIGYDAEILGKLESVKNKSTYIKDLIRKDIDGKLKPITEFTKETEEKAKEYSSITEGKYKEQFDNNMEKSINFITNTVKDTDVIDRLSSMENKSEYVRNLILMDIGLVNQEGKRFLLLDENGDVRSKKRTISERRKEVQKEYNKRTGYKYNKEYREKNKENYKMQSVHFKREEIDSIDEYCKKNNMKRNFLIREATMKYIGKSVRE